jgi:dephospho-CoA kinase
VLVIGLTGGIGSGKSTAAFIFENNGIEIIDADAISREVVEPESKALIEIAKHFGDELINEQGMLERNKLRKVIFQNPDEKDWLEKLLHPLITQSINARINSSTTEYCMLVSPLLLETDQHKLVDRILVIDVSVETQLQRTLSRDNSEESIIKSIIASQISRKERLKRADDVLKNELNIDTLEREAQSLHLQYLAAARITNASK